MHALSIGLLLSTLQTTTQMIPALVAAVATTFVLAPPPDLSLELWGRVVAMLCKPASGSLPPVSLKNEDQIRFDHFDLMKTHMISDFTLLFTLSSSIGG